MRENERTRRNGAREKNEDGMSVKKALYIAGTILALGIISFIITVNIYNNNLEKVYYELGTTETEEKLNKREVKTEAASSNIRKNNKRNGK